MNTLRKIKSVLFICFLLTSSFNLSAQATLPYSYNLIAVPTGTGITSSGLATYTSSPAIKFALTGNYLVLNFSGIPGTLKFNLKWNQTTSVPRFPGSFVLQESTDGIAYTNVQVFDATNGTPLVNGISTPITINSLKTTTRYIKWLYLSKTNGNIALGGIVLSAYVNPNILTLSTQAASAVGSTSATLNGTIDSFDPSSAFVNAYGFCWNTTGNPTISDSKTDKGFNSSTGLFSHSLSSLNTSTTYYVKAYATDASGNTTYGTQVSFTTGSGLSVLSTLAPSSITSTTATLNGTINSLGDTQITSHGFCWNTTGSPTTSESKIDLGSRLATGSISSNVSSLLPNTTYYIRSYATNSAGTSYGTDVILTTSSGLASASTQTTTAISSIAATLNGTIISLGDSPVTAHGFCWNTTGAPTTTDSKVDIGVRSVAGTLSSNISNLTPNTTYYVRTWATNSAGTVYSTDVTFTTTTGLGSVSTQAGTQIKSRAVTLNATILSLGDSPVTAYGFCANTTGSPTLADFKINKGTILNVGTFTYDITGISPNTTYFVRSYITNSAGTFFGTEISFTTPTGLPLVSTEASTLITGTTATLNGTISAEGDTPVTSYGFCWSTTGTPTIADIKIDKGALNVTGSYTHAMTNLEMGKVYYIRAYATNTNGTSYGSLQAFQTLGVIMNVTVPTGTNECWIIGNFVTWNLTNAKKMTKIDQTHYSITLDESTFEGGVTKSTLQYKYLSGGGDWAYVEKDAQGAELISNRTYSTSDVVATWAKIYNASQTPIPMKISFNVTVPENVSTCYINGNFNNWILPTDSTLMTRGIPLNGQVVFSKTLTVSNINTLMYRFSAGPSLSYDQTNPTADFVYTSANTNNIVYAFKSVYTNVTTPIISLNNSALTGFSYTSGNGPSTDQSFTVSGTDLTQNIVVNAPTNFEISVGSGSNFTGQSMLVLNQTAGVVNSTALYVRLKAGLTANTYNETLNITSTGATSKSVNLSGTVSAAALNPVISTSATTITGLDYQQGSGPSTDQSFTVGGSDLSSDIAISAPTNFEISTASGGSFLAQAQIVLTQLAGIVSPTLIYVRLKAGLGTNIYSESLNITSTGVSTKSITLSGTVTAVPVPLILNSVASVSGLDYQPGAGPSSSQSISISGANLTSNIVITPPANFEMSLDNQQTFGTNSQELIPQNGTVASTTIYLRLAASLSVGDYLGTMNILSTGAIGKSIQLSGSVKSSVSRVVNIIAGGLEAALSTDITSVTDLTVGGSMDARDFKAIRDLMPSLRNLDLSAVQILIYTGTGGTSLSPTTTYLANQIPTRAFYNKNLNQLLLPNVVNTTISSQAFYGFSSANPLMIPDMIKTAGSGLNGCAASFIVNPSHTVFSSLDGVLYNKSQGTLYQVPTSKVGSFTVPSTVTNIGSGAFYGCTGITDIALPTTLTYINFNAFFGCTGLTKITIPQSVLTLQSSLFLGCINLTEIKILNPTPITLTTQPFTGITSTCILKVPQGSLAAYKAATYWKDFTNIVEWGLSIATSGVTNVGTTTVTLNGNVADLGDSPVSAYGFCWNTGGSPTINDFVTNNGTCSSTGLYNNAITGLSQSTQYYVRSFATNLSNTVYGNEVSFSTFGPPAAAGLIIGSKTLCQGENSIVYSTTGLPTATSYKWTLPTGATGSSTTNSITVNYGLSAVSGDITVKGSNSYGDGIPSSLSITVKPLVGAIGSISGNSTICAGSKSVIYTVAPVSNANGYIWTLPTGATGTSSTNSITVDFSNTALSGNITVKAKNDCNWSTISSLAITVNAKPISPTITLIPKMYENVLHSNSTTGNQWYNSKGAIIGAVNQDYNVLANEEYYVLVSNSSCVSEPSNIIKITNTAIHSPAMLESIKMYPNPVRNELKIDFDGETDISIVNLMGQVVYSANLIKNVVVQTSTLPSGVYLVKFGKGSIFAIKKFVKEQ